MSSAGPGTGEAESRGRPAPVGRTDVLIALVVTLALSALYASTFQVRQYGDAPLLMQQFVRSLDVTNYWAHLLYYPAAWALLGLCGFSAPIDALVWVSCLSGALTVAFAFLLARLWGAGRFASAVAALLLAFSPGVWFFSTTIEVHTLHAACVGLCALVTWLAPWRRAVAAALLSAAFLPLLYFSHQSGVLLGPGFVLLAQAARVRGGAPRFSLARLWLGIAPLFLAALVAALVVTAVLNERTVRSMLGATDHVVRTFERASGWSTALDGWVTPLGLVTPLFLVALARRRLRGWTLGAVLVMVVPSALFFVTWGLAEHGGYALPSALVLAALGASALEPVTPARRWLALLALALQVALGWGGLRAYDGPEWREHAAWRSAAVREALPEGGVVVSLNIHSQYIEFHVPEARELSLYEAFTSGVRAGDTPEQLVERTRPLLEPVLASGAAVALDLEGFRFAVERQPRLAPLVDALEAWLRERCAVEPSASAPETILRLSPR